MDGLNDSQFIGGMINNDNYLDDADNVIREV